MNDKITIGEFSSPMFRIGNMSLEEKLALLLGEVRNGNAKAKDLNLHTYGVLALAFLIFQMEFDDTKFLEAEISEKVKSLKAKLDHLEICYTKKSPVINLLLRFLSGNDRKLASAHARVIRKAIEQGIDAKALVAWILEKGGIQAILNDSTDPDERGSGDDKGSPAQSKHALVRDATYARQLLREVVILNISKEKLPVGVEPPHIDTEYAAVVMHNVDGSIKIKAITEDSSITTKIFASVTRENGLDGEAVKAEEIAQLDKLLAKEKFKTSELKLVNPVLFQNCKSQWEAESGCIEDTTGVPPDLEDYEFYLFRGSRKENFRRDSGESDFDRGIQLLEGALEANPGLAVYLDREFDRNINRDLESMPKIRRKTCKPKQKDVYRSVIQSHLKQLRSEQAAPLQILGDDVQLSRLMQLRQNDTNQP